MLAVYQKALLDTALRVRALRFGSFTLKSGRVSPYFFNAGAFCDGAALLTLARAYAQRILVLKNNWLEFDVVYGPAYKGIPLVAATSAILAAEHGINIPWAFNRKEEKNHGEGGLTVGASLAEQRVLLLDDVLTAGTAIRASLSLLTEVGASAVGVLVILDREERIDGELSALQQLSTQYAVRSEAIITLSDLLDYVRDDTNLHTYLPAMQDYRAQYGVGVSE